MNSVSPSFSALLGLCTQRHLTVRPFWDCVHRGTSRGLFGTVYTEAPHAAFLGLCTQRHLTRPFWVCVHRGTLTQPFWDCVHRGTSRGLFGTVYFLGLCTQRYPHVQHSALLGLCTQRHRHTSLMRFFGR